MRFGGSGEMSNTASPVRVFLRVPAMTATWPDKVGRSATCIPWAAALLLAGLMASQPEVAARPDVPLVGAAAPAALPEAAVVAREQPEAMAGASAAAVVVVPDG